MNNKKLQKIMAYVCVPLFFVLLGVIIIWVAIKPLAKTYLQTANLVITDYEPTFEETEDEDFVAPDDVVSDNSVIKASEINLPNIGDKIGAIVCDRVFFNLDLYFSDDYPTLEKGIGIYPGSHYPGRNKPILAAGHANSFMLPTADCVVGDIFYIVTYYGKFYYQVTDIQVYDSDKCIYDLEQDKEQLILYCCYPFGEFSPYNQRRFIYADKISGPTIDLYN